MEVYIKYTQFGGDYKEDVDDGDDDGDGDSGNTKESMRTKPDKDNK